VDSVSGTVLVVNAGSSSLKLRVLSGSDEVVASADLAAVGGDVDASAMKSALPTLGAVDAVGHRIVHGGTLFRSPVVVDESVRRRLESLTDLAPLHQPKSLAALDAVSSALPDVPAVACFDTAFHATIPEAASTFALPAEWRERWTLRRYGFHGLSHAYIARRAAEMAPGRASRIVSCHLGAGASLCAVLDGRSVDTTMGFTPLDGLVMATRSGSVDPGLLLWLETHAGMPSGELAAALEYRSGLLGLTGTADMREIMSRGAAAEGRAVLARDVYLHRLCGSVASMTAALGGLDVLAFTGGVGENSAGIRALAMAGLGFLGVRGDASANESGSGDREIGATDAPVRSMVISAREDIEIARQTRSVVGLTPAGTWVALPWSRGAVFHSVGCVLLPLLTAVIAAILYGTGAALQQHQASTAPDKAAGRPSLLLLLMRRPWWLLGLATEQAGFAAHAVALRSGPLTTVQMLMASSLVFSVATVRLWSRQPLGWGVWAACAAVVGGIGAFVALTSLSGLAGGHGLGQGLPRHAGLAAACLGISAAPLAAAGLAAAGRRRAILLAVAAGLADAGMAVVTMAFAHTVPHGLTATVTSWPLYALIAAGFCSFLLTQTAYQAGCPMVTLPVIAVVTPVSSLAAGAGLLGETPHLGAARAVALGFAVLLTATGLVTLARRTAVVDAPRALLAEAQAPSSLTFDHAKSSVRRPRLDHQQCRLWVQPGDDDLGNVGQEQTPIFGTPVAERSGQDRSPGDLRLARPLSLLALPRVRHRTVQGESRIPPQIRPLARTRHRPEPKLAISELALDA